MRQFLRFITAFFFLIVSFSVCSAGYPKKWTFLIFINGNNNLDYFGALNIRSMEQIGSNDRVNVVVQWASKATGQTVRMLIKKSTDPNRVTSPVLANLGQVDMGSYQTLEDFIGWGVANFPAEHYFLNVWDHGSGWHLSGNQHPFFDISYDELTGNIITTEQLGWVAQYAASIIGHKLDIFGSDACLMGMAEIASELENSVSYFVGSQELEPGLGWPYADILRNWQAALDASPAAIAKMLTHTYVAAYKGGSYGYSDVTFSAYDLSQFAHLNATIAQLSHAIQNLSQYEKQTFLNQANYVQTFYFRDYLDLIDLTQQMSYLNLPNLPAQLLFNVQSAAQLAIIANETTDKYQRAHGMSIWLPTNILSYQMYMQRYMGLRFSQQTQWGYALAALYPQ